MEISPTSFLHLLRCISDAVSQKESANEYDYLLEEIIEEGGLYHRVHADSEVQSGVEVENLPILEVEKVFGREDEKEQLLSKLIVYEKRIQLSAIPILGGSGIGKTTLARLVYEDEEVKEHFELRVWVKVDGQELWLHHAAQEILKSAMGMPCSVDDQDELDEMVRDSLQFQRCLIVFDGIESMTEELWLHMNQYWFGFVDLGSKVLITTPSEDVADLVSNQPFELTQLLPSDGWSLCRYLAFDSSEGVKVMSGLMAENLASLCGGVPLLLKLFGSLMRHDHMLRDLLFSVDLSDGILLFPWDATVAILLCLWALPVQLRQCLAYCALFPKGYALKKQKIIDMWIADGLVKPSPGNYSLQDIGNSYFHQLLCRSFFIDITCNQYDDFIEFRIPGLIHKMAEDVARIVYREKFGLIGSIDEDAGKLSLVLPFVEKYNSEGLQALILSPTLDLGGSLDHSLIEFKGLQSLDLSCSGIRNLSDDICALKEIRCLNLSHTFIERLPDSIVGLSQLQTLDLSWCYHLNALPKGMRSLTRMSHLDLSRCESLRYLPSGIGFLRSLTLMPLFVLGKDHDCARLGELGLLSQIQGRLEIRNLENVREISEARDARIDQKDLQYLGLSWCQNAGDCFKVLEFLQPNPHLKVLNVRGYMGFIFPRWISSINSLVKISITDCGCKKLPSLGQLPFLKELQLERMMNVERIGPEYGDGIGDVFFPSLEQLELYDLPRLVNWSDARVPRLSDLARLFQSGATVSNASSSCVFPSLKTVTVEGCPRLPSLPSLPALPDLIVRNSNKRILHSLTSLASLSSLLINDMEVGWKVFSRDLCKLKSLKKLILCNIKDEDFVSVYGQREVTALEHLGILHCPEIKHLDLYIFPLLQKLHIVDCPRLYGILLLEEHENTSLMELVVEDCPRLVACISFDKLHSLRKLILKHCGGDLSMRYTGEFEKIKKLEYLFVGGCPKLESRLRAFPWLISHIPCIIVGNHKANFNDSEDLTEASISAPYEQKSEVMVPSPHRFSHGPHKSTTQQSIGHVMAIKYNEIRKATKNFGSDMLLGRGGFGNVFKGWIHENYLTAMKAGSGLAVAIKKWRPDSNQGLEQWVNEKNYLSQLHHPNLVKLIGYCFKEGNMILVYEFMPKGSLDNHLITRGHQSLSWATRIKVAVGAARGLSFLHDLEIPVIHRGVTSGDILLDGEFNAKFSDFGLARNGPTGDTTHVSTRVMGTFGYVAPEYYMTGHLTTKCDVYGFGVVLLELLSGRRVLEINRPAGETNLVEWAKPNLGDRRKVSWIMDSGLEGQYTEDEAYTVAKLACRCVSLDPKERPRMAEVVVALEQLQSPKTFL